MNDLFLLAVAGLQISACYSSCVDLLDNIPYITLQAYLLNVPGAKLILLQFLQSYITHSIKVEGLRGIITVPAKLESTSLVFAYGVDLFFTRIAPSRTYDSLTEDFSYALLLITIVALVAAIFVTWVLSERKELQDKWR